MVYRDGFWREHSVMILGWETIDPLSWPWATILKVIGQIPQFVTLICITLYYSKTCDEGTPGPQLVSLHDGCPLVTGTFQC